MDTNLEAVRAAMVVHQRVTRFENQCKAVFTFIGGMALWGLVITLIFLCAELWP